MVWFHQFGLVPVFIWACSSRRTYIGDKSLVPCIIWSFPCLRSSQAAFQRCTFGSLSFLKVFCVAAWPPAVSPPVSAACLLLPPSSLTPRSPHPPLPPPALHPAQLPGCTGTLWFRPPRCTAAHCSLSTAEPQLHQQEEQAPHLPPLSSFLCLHLSFSPISLSLTGSSSSPLHLSVPSLFTPWPPSAPLSLQIHFSSFEY